MKYRLRFKVNTFTYKVLNGLAPAYMSDIVQKDRGFKMAGIDVALVKGCKITNVFAPITCACTHKVVC